MSDDDAEVVAFYRARLHEEAADLAFVDPAYLVRKTARSRVDSGRALILLWEDTVETVETLKAAGLQHSHHDSEAQAYANAIRLQASVWDHHPDWKSSWRTGWMRSCLMDAVAWKEGS